MSGYCDVAPGHPLHGPYHDTEYGFPQRDERVLFERLLLEINQAGLSWETMLRKREGFRRAYDGFDVDAVAVYGDADRTRLLADPGIIRNRLKVDAAIHNAGVVRGLRGSHGGFAAWLEYLLLRQALARRIGKTGIPAHRLLWFWGSAVLAGALALAGKIWLTTRSGPAPSVMRFWGWQVLPAPALDPALVAALLIPVFAVVYLGLTALAGASQLGNVLSRLRRE